MKLVERRARADAAFVEVRQRERRWSRQTEIVRAWFARHRASTLVGGGFATGVAVSLLPIGSLVRAASAFAGTLTLLVEGPLMRLIAAHRRDARRSSSAT